MFNFDVRPLVWTDYWRDYVLGARKFILKEEESTLPLARRNLKRRYFIGQTVRLAAAVGAIQLLAYTSDTVAEATQMATGFMQQAWQFLPQAVRLA